MAKEKLTKKNLEQAVALKREGLNDCDIAAALGVCKQTFSKWINHPETNLQRTLSEQLKKAEATYKEQLLQTIRAAALAKNSNWTAAAWLLERKYPDEFSQNRQLANAEAEKAPKIVLGVAVQPVGSAAVAGASLDGRELLAATSASLTGSFEVVEEAFVDEAAVSKEKAVVEEASDGKC